MGGVRGGRLCLDEKGAISGVLELLGGAESSRRPKITPDFRGDIGKQMGGKFGEMGVIRWTALYGSEGLAGHLLRASY